MYKMENVNIFIQISWKKPNGLEYNTNENYSKSLFICEKIGEKIDAE